MNVQERKMEMEDEKMKKDELSALALMSELHNDIYELKEMQSRLREKKAHGCDRST